MAAVFGSDAYSPDEIAERVENVGVTKARLPMLSTFTLGILAGGFIGLGGIYFTLITGDPQINFAIGRILGGIAFSLGYILVVVAGAEVFTGNNLLVMAWAARRISTLELLRNWLIVFLGNGVGAIGLAVLVVWSGHPTMHDGAVAQQAIAIATNKVNLSFFEAFSRGILANILICLAAWAAMAGRSLTDKVLATVFPISAFMAAGFEQSVANLYFIPLGIMLQGATAPVDGGAALTMTGFVGNLLPVTLGNIVGGSVLVAFVYYTVYRRGHSIPVSRGHAVPASPPAGRSGSRNP